MGECKGCAYIDRPIYEWPCDVCRATKNGRSMYCPEEADHITNNVQPVVFCKDCKWLDRWNGCDCHNPRFGDGYANYPPPTVRDDFFCADGERREGGMSNGVC